MEITLTNDADYLICALYKSYKDKLKRGISKADAKFMGSSQSMHQTIMQEWSYDDVDETCRELSRAGMLKCNYADNVTIATILTDTAIVFMENRFVDGIVQILDYMAKIKSAIFR